MELVQKLMKKTSKYLIYSPLTEKVLTECPLSTSLSQMSRQTASQPGWCHLDTQDKWLKIHCLDVKLR